MSTTLVVTFDGQVLRPELPLDLELNRRYAITIQSALPQVAEGDAWDALESAIGSIEAPRDWASEHDHYLYGIPKRHSEADE